jgi:transposase
MKFLNNIHWGRGQPIDIEERNIIINLCGPSNSDIALVLSRDVRTVNKWYQRWYNTGEVNVIKQRGGPRATTSEEDLNISLHAIQKPSITSNKIKTEAQIDCSHMNVGRHLRESKLFRRVARIKF